MITPEPRELQELVRELHRLSRPWLPSGLGSRLDWGPPLQAGPDGEPPLTLSVARLNRVVEHNPGDFTITVEAGCSLAEVQQTLAEHSQWLAVDWPWGTAPDAGVPSAGGVRADSTSAGSLSAGSIGGLVARGLSGGYRQRYLGVRDQLIGIGLLRADGTSARAGGRVVKNVAGYDLMRLLCGSWGSLALITEVTLRSQPLPPLRRGLWLSGPLPRLAALARWLLNASLSPERLDWQGGRGQEPGLLVALASISADTLQEQLDCLIAKATEQGCGATVLEATALAEHLQAGQGEPAAADWLLRLGVRPDQSSLLLDQPTLDALTLAVEAGSGLGMAWAPGAALPAYRVEALRRRCQELGGYLTVLRQPAGCRVQAWGDAPSRRLIEAIKRQFDPQQQLAPGRLPGVAA